jgi:hypothetical protein
VGICNIIINIYIKLYNNSSHLAAINYKHLWTYAFYRRFGEFRREITKVCGGQAKTTDEYRRRWRWRTDCTKNEKMSQEHPAKAIGGGVVGQRPKHAKAGKQRAGTITHALIKRCFRGISTPRVMTMPTRVNYYNIIIHVRREIDYLHNNMKIGRKIKHCTYYILFTLTKYRV